MKSLIKYIEECMGAATPASTMGMGNPMAPTDGMHGSGDIPVPLLMDREKKPAPIKQKLHKKRPEK